MLVGVCTLVLHSPKARATMTEYLLRQPAQSHPRYYQASETDHDLLASGAL